MKTYRTIKDGDVEAGVRLIRLFKSSGDVRAQIALTRGPDTEAVTYNYPPVQMMPADAFRLAENKLEGAEEIDTVIELEEGVEWDSGWGTLRVD
jgi:hypothetical protein